MEEKGNANFVSSFSFCKCFSIGNFPLNLKKEQFYENGKQEFDLIWIKKFNKKDKNLLKIQIFEIKFTDKLLMKLFKHIKH